MHVHYFDNTYKSLSMVCRYLHMHVHDFVNIQIPHMHDHDFVNTFTCMSMILLIPTQTCPWFWQCLHIYDHDFDSIYKCMTMILTIPTHAWPWFWQYLHMHDHDFDNTYTCKTMIMIDTVSQVLAWLCGEEASQPWMFLRTKRDRHRPAHPAARALAISNNTYRYVQGLRVSDFHFQELSLQMHAQKWNTQQLFAMYWNLSVRQCLSKAPCNGVLRVVIFMVNSGFIKLI